MKNLGRLSLTLVLIGALATGLVSCKNGLVNKIETSVEEALIFSNIEYDVTKFRVSYDYFNKGELPFIQAIGPITNNNEKEVGNIKPELTVSTSDYEILSKTQGKIYSDMLEITLPDGSSYAVGLGEVDLIKPGVDYYHITESDLLPKKHRTVECGFKLIFGNN